MITEQSILFSLDDFQQLGKRSSGGETAVREHCFWSISMPDPNVRPKYYESIAKIYRDFLDPPLLYVDAYHSIMNGSPIFNETVQNLLISKADYMVVDLSCLRHNILFEAGFGMGSGMQVIFYVDLKNPIGKKSEGPSAPLKTLKAIKDEFPKQIENALFTQPDRSIPIVSTNSHKHTNWDKISCWFQKHVHEPGTKLRRRRCCKIHFVDEACMFQPQLDDLLTQKHGPHYYMRFSPDHKNQELYARQYLESNGFHPVESHSSIAENESYLCKTCFNLKLAKRIIIDGTSPDDYSKECAERVFILGMAVAKLRKAMPDNLKMKMLFEERVGAVGMYVGAKASWDNENWAEQIKRELDTML